MVGPESSPSQSRWSCGKLNWGSQDALCAGSPNATGHLWQCALPKSVSVQVLPQIGQLLSASILLIIFLHATIKDSLELFLSIYHSCCCYFHLHDIRQCLSSHYLIKEKVYLFLVTAYHVLFSLPFSRRSLVTLTVHGFLNIHLRNHTSVASNFFLIWSFTFQNSLLYSRSHKWQINKNYQLQTT